MSRWPACAAVAITLVAGTAGGQLPPRWDLSLQAPGAVGVWSKADSVTEFDRFTWEEAK